MATTAKEEFLERFSDLILRPRALRYKVQFPGPGGANAVEAALRLARKVTGRPAVAGFTNGFHGTTGDLLAVIGRDSSRTDGMPPLPFDGDGDDSVGAVRAMLDSAASDADLPAAILVETIQAEGGVNVASDQWLIEIEALCRASGVLLIVDDIQVGCGRTGTFFSFERSGITPDIVCLSKSLSGYGFPLAVTLINEELDVWSEGEHSGTFRGFNPAFVTGAAALELYWRDDELTAEVVRKGELVASSLEKIATDSPERVAGSRGRGLINGLVCHANSVDIALEAFKRGLLVEPVGRNDEVIKLLPPLTIADEALLEGLELLSKACAAL